MPLRIAVITGASGQDGSYLRDLLLSKGYDVRGVDFDIRHREELAAFLREVRPDECYHLAAHHRSSAAQQVEIDEDAEERRFLETNVLSVQTILSTLRADKPECKVFLAGSCHMFGEARISPQTEETPFLPNNMYGITKVTAALLGRMFRERHGMFVSTGILYNHESPLRPAEFVTSRIARTAAQIYYGSTEPLRIGDLSARVDWGFAGDYVQAMWLMLQAPVAEDLIIASGELHTVQDFVATAFERVGLDWHDHVVLDPSVHRAVSSGVYQGDISRITHRLGWRPSLPFRDLVQLMVDRQLRDLRQTESDSSIQ